MAGIRVAYRVTFLGNPFCLGHGTKTGNPNFHIWDGKLLGSIYGIYIYIYMGSYGIYIYGMVNLDLLKGILLCGTGDVGGLTSTIVFLPAQCNGNLKRTHQDCQRSQSTTHSN